MKGTWLWMKINLFNSEGYMHEGKQKQFVAVKSWWGPRTHVKRTANVYIRIQYTVYL